MTEPAALQRVNAALNDHFGHQPARASISFVGVEPLEVLRFEAVPGEYAYVSLGMSRHPMTGADELVLAADGPRAELLLQVRDGAERHRDLWRRVAILAAAPVVEGVVYQPGATIDLGEPVVPGSRCTGAVVSASTVSVPDDVVVLELLPATSTELAWARVHGSAALRERWAEHEVDARDLDRAAVALG